MYDCVVRVGPNAYSATRRVTIRATCDVALRPTGRSDRSNPTAYSRTEGEKTEMYADP